MDNRTKLNKVVIWGHKLHSHTHSYIHNTRTQPYPHTKTTFQLKKSPTHHSGYKYLFSIFQDDHAFFLFNQN